MEEYSERINEGEARENFKTEIATLLWSIDKNKLRIDDSIFSVSKEGVEGYTSASHAAALINNQIKPPVDIAQECLGKAVFLYAKDSDTYFLDLRYTDDVASLTISCKNNKLTFRAEVAKTKGEGREVLTGDFNRSLEQHARNAKGLINAVTWVVKERAGKSL